MNIKINSSSLFRQITCSEPSCKKQINTQDEFLLHIQSHKDKDMFGSTPISYPCTFCSKVFRLKKYRTRHINIKHAADYRCVLSMGSHSASMASLFLFHTVSARRMSRVRVLGGRRKKLGKMWLVLKGPLSLVMKMRSI